MFTGIVEGIGEVVSVERAGGGRRIGIDPGRLQVADVRCGDSIAVNGVCLTAVALEQGRFHFDVSAETLERTTLGAIGEGVKVNLEKALLPTTRLGGHLVSGHIDGVGRVAARRGDGGYERFGFRIPSALCKYLAYKGSICIDGVSLTVNAVADDVVDVMVIPHTLLVTNLSLLGIGAAVNIEVDIIARYLERLLQSDGVKGGTRSSARGGPE